MKINYANLLMMVAIGVWTAVQVDYQAFRAMKNWKDAIDYDWGIVLFRAFQGAIVGLVGYAGLNQFGS